MNNEDIEIKKEPPFLKRIKLLNEKITNLEEKFTKILERLETPTISVETPKIEVKTYPEPIAKVEIQSISQYPVPMEYREIIDSVLNHKFGIKIDPMSDRPAFMLTIIVPPEYSNLSEAEKKMQVTDIRCKVIGYAEGSNGVRQYAELVAGNLGAEIRAQIIMDRAKLQ